MEPDRPQSWKLVRFIEHLDRWAQAESPGQNVRLRVFAWVMARHDDPYAGVVRASGFANLWYGRVPNTRDRAGTMVTCSYFIFEKTRIIRCNAIGRFGEPR